MKTDVFKKLIKEAVREAVREELAILLSEDSKKEQTIGFNTQQTYTQPNNYQAPKTVTDPITEMFNMTRASMTQDEYRNLVSATSDMVQAPGLGMNPIEQFRPGPQAQFNSTEMDFVKNAGAIFKASVEKDKNKFVG